MFRLTLRMTGALALLAALAAQAPAQPAPASAGSTFRVRHLLGSTVALQGGTRAGTVEDVVLNDEGVVEYLIVSEGGKLVTVPWEAARYNYDRRAVTINIAPERFREIPTYTTERYPDYYAPTYRTQVYKYYGLTPGRVRRFERRP